MTGFGDGTFGFGLFGATGPVATVRCTIDAAFGSYHGDLTYTWTQIHDTSTATGYVRAIQWQRGLDDLILGRTETGTGLVLLNNSTRAWDPANAASPFFPNVTPDLPVRATATVSGVDYPLFQHFFSGFPRTREGPNVGWVPAPTTDGFARLALASPAPENASLTVDPGGINNTLVFTAKNPGIAEEDITVQFIGGPFKPVRVSVKGKAIEVRYHLTGLHGDPDDTATIIKNAINAHAGASQLVTVTDGVGSDGSGSVLTDFGPQNLAGGDTVAFPQEFSGARISRCLDQGSWPAALRQIAPGVVQVSAVPFSSNEQGRLLSHVLDVAGEPGEFGMVYVDGRGYCVFLDRNALYTNAAQATVSATFTDDPAGGFPTYTNSQPNFDREHVINEWVGAQDGGVAQIVQDADSILKHGRTTHSVASLLTTDTMVQTAMSFGRDEYGQPVQRLQSITVKPGNDLTTWTTCLGLELGDRVRVLEHPPGGGAAIDETYVVTKLAGQVGPDLADGTFVFGLWPVRITNYFIWDDVTFGNSDTTVLAYN